jgi:hypothetical protein
MLTGGEGGHELIVKQFRWKRELILKKSVVRGLRGLPMIVTAPPPRHQGTKKVMEYKPLSGREEEIAKAIAEAAYIVPSCLCDFVAE